MTNPVQQPMHRCRALYAVSGCAFKYSADSRRGLCPPEAGCPVQAILPPRCAGGCRVSYPKLLQILRGREFTEIRTYLIITQEAQKSQFVQYDPKKWLDFHSKVSKVNDILTEKGIRHRKLSKPEVNEYCHRFMAFQFRHGPFSMTNFKASDEYLKIGDRVIRSYPLVDIDEINLPSVIRPYTRNKCQRLPYSHRRALVPHIRSILGLCGIQSGGADTEPA